MYMHDYSRIFFDFFRSWQPRRKSDVTHSKTKTNTRDSRTITSLRRRSTHTEVDSRKGRGQWCQFIICNCCLCMYTPDVAINGTCTSTCTFIPLNSCCSLGIRWVYAYMQILTHLPLTLPLRWYNSRSSFKFLRGKMCCLFLLKRLLNYL